MAFPRIGIYSVSGAGKSFALKALSQSRSDCALKEGSEVITEACMRAGLSGLDDFKTSNRKQQDEIRHSAIQSLHAQAEDRTVVVAGHYSILKIGHEKSTIENLSDHFDVVLTSADLAFYTHIVYLAPTAETVVAQWEQDSNSGKRLRGTTPTVSTVSAWMQFEARNLLERCIQSGIFFTTINPERSDAITVGLSLSLFLDDMIERTETANRVAVLAAVQSHLQTNSVNKKVVLVIDGDRTLSECDTGDMYWSLADPATIASSPPVFLPAEKFNPLKIVFQQIQPEYCFDSFHQVSMLYSSVPDEMHAGLCSAVAERVKLQPEWISFLRQVLQNDSIEAMVVTSGLAEVWERVLATAEMPQCKVFGMSPLCQGFVVTPEDKAAIVRQIQSFTLDDGATAATAPTVFCFGDSALDIPMLKAADESFLVVVDPEHRSKSMDKRLSELGNEVASLVQIPLPSGIPARTCHFPMTTLAWVASRLSSLVASKNGDRPLQTVEQGLLSSPGSLGQVFINFGSDASARVIASKMRDARNAGARLRDAHEEAGRFLAAKLVDMLGAESSRIQHVLGSEADGFQPAGCSEGRCLIIALMRAGLPMALGAARLLADSEPALAFVSDAETDKHLPKLLQGKRTVVIADAVINNGTTVRQAVRRIATLLSAAGRRTQDQQGVRVFVLAGTVQAGAVVGIEAEFGPLGGLTHPGSPNSGVDSVAVLGLRTSATKFTGTGTVDTGNRLFNTTVLD